MFGFISELLTKALASFDETLKDTPAHQIVLVTAVVYFAYNQYHNPWILRGIRGRHNKTYTQRILDILYEITKNLPPVKKYLAKELHKNLQSIKNKLVAERSEMILQAKIPEEGTLATAILSQFNIELGQCAFDLQLIKNSDQISEFIVQEGDGQDSGALYAVHPKELTELLKETVGKTNLSNTMHDKWPRINGMQAEVIRWCQVLFGGSEQGYGLLTHGGTGSIIESIAAYVIKARNNGINFPEIVVPETAHAAFKKAADLTGATLIVVPVDKRTGAVTAAVMEKYISGNTAVMVGSAPSFMNGIYDPIATLGQLAKKKKVPFHVDACLGGFLTAFLDTSKEPMDFRVPGVTSLSADLHKYGCCPKGTSVCLFSKDSPALSVYSALNWPGGLYTTPGILDGSASGARVAEVYVTLSYYGKKRFQEISKNIINLRERLQEKVVELSYQIDKSQRGDIYVYANPQSSILGFRSNTLNPHLIADELEQRGWKLNLLQNPSGFHLCLTHVHTLVKGLEEKFIADLLDAVVTARSSNKKSIENVKVYGVISKMPTAVQEEVCTQYQKARLVYESSPGKLGFFNQHSQPNNFIETQIEKYHFKQQ